MPNPEVQPASGGIADIKDMFEATPKPLAQSRIFDEQFHFGTEVSHDVAEFYSPATQGASDANYAPGANTWGDLENRIHDLEARLSQMNTPEANRVLQELRDFERQIQDTRSNPFAFLPNQDTIARMNNLQYEAINALRLTAPPQPADTAAIQQTDAPSVDANAATAAPMAPLPQANTWDELQQNIRILEARLSQMNTPEASRVLQELRDFERQIQDMRSNPFAFLPNSDTLNRMNTLQYEAINAMRLPAPPQPADTTPVQQTDTAPVDTSTDSTASTDPVQIDPTQTPDVPTDIPPDPNAAPVDPPADTTDPTLDPNAA
jgi:hypothetical protein